MVIRVEAQSLDTLTRLADDPPLNIRRYPPVPPPHDPHSNSPSAHQLKLYIVRVPNSPDIILTPLKPQSNTVTAQDVISCLYYLRIQPVDAAASGMDKPRSQSLQSDNRSGRSPLAENRPGYPARASFSGESQGANQLHPGGGAVGNFLSPSTASLTSVGSGQSLGPNGNDFEITFIRRDRTSGGQATIGRIVSNSTAGTPLDAMSPMPNSFAAAMMMQEARDSKQGRRDRKRMNLEIWTPGYEKFIPRRRKTNNMRIPEQADTVSTPGTMSSSSSFAETQNGETGRVKDLLWPAPIPPPPPGSDDDDVPPVPPKHSGGAAMNPAMARLSRFTEVYSPDTPNPSSALSAAPKIPRKKIPSQEYELEDDVFRRTLNLEGEGFWKSTGKRLSALGAHRRVKSQPDTPQYGVSEETRLAMEQMGLNSPPSSGAGTPAPQPGYFPNSPPPPPPPSYAQTPESHAAMKESKGKGYTFEPPLKQSGRCEFETNSVGRKIRLRLHPNSTLAGSPFGNATVVKADTILLSTLSFQPPDGTSSGGGDNRSPSPGRLGDGKSSSRFRLSEKFKAKLQRQGSWTETIEQEAGSGSKSKLGSLLVEGEGTDMLDLVVVSNMGVFWKKYCEWSASLREGI